MRYEVFVCYVVGHRGVRTCFALLPRSCESLDLKDALAFTGRENRQQHCQEREVRCWGVAIFIRHFSVIATTQELPAGPAWGLVVLLPVTAAFPGRRPAL